jgi:hypothetical protein
MTADLLADKRTSQGRRSYQAGDIDAGLHSHLLQGVGQVLERQIA